jgi:phytoene synthase
MAGIYRRLLERIAARPEEAVRRRTTLPVPEKAWVAARGMLAGSRVLPGSAARVSTGSAGAGR